jgi:DNA gyrase/topoisomerase IV subunit B
VAANLAQPQFWGPARNQVHDPELAAFVRAETAARLEAFLADHPADAEAIAAHVLEAQRARTTDPKTGVRR